MIDEKKLIERMNRCGIEFLSHYYTNQEIIDIFCDLVNEEVEEQAEKQLKTGEWIPCSERLPQDGVDVLVWFEYFRYGNYNRLFQTTGISYTYDEKWSGFVNGQSGWNQLRVIAWQPLPEPYKPNND